MTESPAVSAAPSTASKQSKWVVSIVVAACVCSILAVTFTWVQNQVLDTNKYVATVAPLAQNKAVQSAITDAVTARLVAATNPKKVIGDALPPKAAPLAGPLSEAITGFVHNQIARLLSTKQFASLWEIISRNSHEQMVAALTGKRTVLNQLAAKGEIKLDLKPIIGPAGAFLKSAGFKVEQPPQSPTLIVFDLSSLQSAQSGIKALKGLTLIFIILAPLLFALAILLSKVRRRTVITVGLSLAGSMVLVGLLLALGEWFYLDGLPANVPQDAAQAFFDTIVRYFARGLRIIAVIGLLVAFSAWWSGNGKAAFADLKGDGLLAVSRVAIVGIGASLLLVLSHPTPLTFLLIIVATAALTWLAGVLARRSAA